MTDDSPPAAAARRSGLGLARVAHAWRRSLQLRVVTSTMLLGMIVLGSVGTYLYGEVGAGLVRSRTEAATAEANRLTEVVQAKFHSTDKTQNTDALTVAAQSIIFETAGSERSRYVVLSRLATNRSSFVINAVRSGEVDDSHIPDAIEAAVAEDAAHQKTQIVSLSLAGSAEPVPCLVVGQQVDIPLAQGYGVYFVYPMLDEVASLRLIQRTLLTGGFVLVLLIGGVAYVVTRQVVAPVRQAAGVAQRLAAGQLTERMVPKGEDDLASLATSFNAMAEGLQRQIRQLEDLSRVQQRFVSDVSHELRTPLTTIRLAGDLIHDSRGQFEPAVSRSAELLRGEVDRFEALLSDLLEISRFDAGAAVLDTEPTDLRRTVAKVVDGCQSLAESKGSRITLIDPGIPCEASYDPRRIERVLRNLVVNAIEHGDGKPVEIIVGGNDSAVGASVRDHGVGLRPGEAGMVFNRFWRADPARARATGGSGLGLAIALEDARLHSGWLQAWGQPGEGAVFRLTLPRASGMRIGSSPVPLNPKSLGARPETARP
ncbi:MAG: HAMP domain-containing histidine kinase [Actinomycetales bacterium]|nr:HAMP domain-containing histidine kinase [Actinomycetales bacterium]